MIVFVSVSVNLVQHWNLIFPPLQEGLTALDIARGGGEEAVCKILQQHTKQETELTEVSQQLHVVSNHTSACTHTHTRARAHTHMRAHTHTLTHTYTIHSSYMTLFGVHEMHGRVHPN